MLMRNQKSEAGNLSSAFRPVFYVLFVLILALIAEPVLAAAKSYRRVRRSTMFSRSFRASLKASELTWSMA